MSQGEGLRLDFCGNENCSTKGKRILLAECKINGEIIGLCAQCCITGFYRVRDYEKAPEKQNTEGVHQPEEGAHVVTQKEVLR